MTPLDLENQRNENTTKLLARSKEDIMADAEAKLANLNVIQTAYPRARISHIAGSTYRINTFEKTSGIIPINRLIDSILVDVVGGLAIRRPEPTSSKLVKYSDSWKS